MDREIFNELEVAAKPLQDFLQKHFGLTTKVEVKIGHVTVYKVVSGYRLDIGMLTKIED